MANECMNYQETIQYLYDSVPMFQQVGGKAYKEGLENTYALDEHFGYPHRKFRSIHIGGTNGKGSCSHTIAAILQSAGYKVGLYTSPHLIDFRERIRVNGDMIPEQYVIDFVHRNRSYFESLQLSFFELTTALAFHYFAYSNVDVAIIEVGLGGRLDCTNIISPDLSVITNISYDHTQFLGNTLTDIATEKAGIIKAATPVVIGETTEATRQVFSYKAQIQKAPIIFAEDDIEILYSEMNHGFTYQTKSFGTFQSELGGTYQIINANTILNAIKQLQRLGYTIDQQAVCNGFGHVSQLTGLMGRWHVLAQSPLTICDTGHNTAGIKYIVKQLSALKYHQLHIVIGMVNDKDVTGVLALLPRDAHYYFTKASIPRALNEVELKELAQLHHLQGDSYPTVVEAVKAAQKNSLPEDVIFVGGSTFIVADLLSHRDTFDFN